MKAQQDNSQYSALQTNVPCNYSAAISKWFCPYLDPKKREIMMQV